MHPYAIRFIGSNIYTMIAGGRGGSVFAAMVWGCVFVPLSRLVHVRSLASDTGLKLIDTNLLHKIPTIKKENRVKPEPRQFNALIPVYVSGSLLVSILLGFVVSLVFRIAMSHKTLPTSLFNIFFVADTNSTIPEE